MRTKILDPTSDLDAEKCTHEAPSSKLHANIISTFLVYLTIVDQSRRDASWQGIDALKSHDEKVNTSPVTIENLPDQDFGTGCQQAPDKLPTTSVLFDVGIV